MAGHRLLETSTPWKLSAEFEIVDATTIDMDRVFFAARYDKGTADYINCPFTKEEYNRFLDALTTAGERWRLSARAYHRVLRVSRTIADLAGEERVTRQALLEAFQLRGQSE